MPRIKKRTIGSRTSKTSRNIHHKVNKKIRIKLKTKTNIGGEKMPVVVEKVTSQITYSTSHSLDHEQNEKNIQNLLKRHAKLLKRLAE